VSNTKHLNKVLLFLPSNRWIATNELANLVELNRDATLTGLWAAVGLHKAEVKTAHHNHGSYFWRRTCE